MRLHPVVELIFSNSVFTTPKPTSQYLFVAGKRSSLFLKEITISYRFFMGNWSLNMLKSSSVAFNRAVQPSWLTLLALTRCVIGAVGEKENQY